jgi:hypothetical protein
METKGHAATNGGLRGHSIGDTYPFNVIWQGGYETGCWCVFDCRNSNVFYTESGTCKDACDLAELKRAEL